MLDYSKVRGYSDLYISFLYRSFAVGRELEDADESYSDGERSEAYGKFERPIHECGGTKGIRSQQSVEGEIGCFRLGLWKMYADQTQLEKRIF